MNKLEGVKVLIGPSTFAAMDSSPMKLLQKYGFDVIDNPYRRRINKRELHELLKGNVKGIIAGLESLDKEIIEASNLRVISRCGSGVSNVDFDAVRDQGIKMYSTPYGPTTAVVELSVGVLLSLLRQVPQMDKDLHQGNWNKKIGSQLEGKTVTIVGFGRIGKRLAEVLKFFRAKIIAVDPFLEDQEIDVPLLELQKALPLSDIIMLHASGDEIIIGEKELSSLKPGAYLLNASRGGLVDHDALVQNLEEGRIAGAWLDTFQQEPYSGPLMKFPNVILTPHIGSYTEECRRSMEMEAVENLIDGFQQIN